MAVKLLLGALAFVVLAIALQGWLFGGDDPGGAASVARPNSIPTATMPANLPEPILLGQSQSAAPGPSAATSPSSSANSYVVKSGETLGAIAAAQGVAPDQQAAWVAEVLRLNGMEDARLLRAGQELLLPRLPTQTARPPAVTGTPTSSTPAAGATTRPGTPAPATATPRPAAGSTPTAGATPAAGSGTYTVQSGDFPLLIAGKLGVPDAQQLAWAEQLIALNNLNPNAMRVGQVLQLPPNTPGR
jgi:LysM repeat protein